MASSFTACFLAVFGLLVITMSVGSLSAQTNDEVSANLVAESGDAAEREAALAVTPPDITDSSGLPNSEAAPVNGFGIEGSVTGRKDARTMSLAIPAPRGQITDRHGEPFAQTRVVWYPALEYGQFEKADRDYVIEWARKRIEQANQIFGIQWQVSDEALWQHYRHRRWLAMPASHVVDEERKKECEGQLMNGLILHPVYLRHYPHGKSASHIIGYTGSAGKLEKGPINYGDPIFERAEGRSGLEKIFNKELSGKDGLLREDYDVDGSLVFKKYETRPVPGGNVVTTLDLSWQVQAEAVLDEYCERGAFVVLEAGVEGLVHVSEMSWTKKNVHPGKIVSTSQEVEVMVLEIDGTKRRVSLGLKQTQRNPWEVFAESNPEGTQVEGEIKNITEFGLFVGLDGDIDGMVHLSDISWDERGEEAIQNFRKGDLVQAVVSEVDVEKERISLSIKALGGDKFAEATGGVKRGSIITVEVTSIEDGGIEVEYEGAKAFIRRSDLSRDRAEQRPERFSVGNKVDVRVTNIDSKTRKLGLSIKAREIAEEKEAVEQYGSSDSGASLGDILGAALKGDE